MKKRVIGIILTITLLCGVLVVPTSEKAEAKSKYQKLENAVLDIKKVAKESDRTNTGRDYTYANFYNTYYDVKYLYKFYVQPMSKFNIKIKNLPKGAKTEFKWACYDDGKTIDYDNGRKIEGCRLFFEEYGLGGTWSTYLGVNDMLPEQGWIKYKKNSEKSYTVYVKDVMGDFKNYRKHHIYWNQVPWDDIKCAISYYAYDIIVTLKDGTKSTYRGYININPVDVQKEYGADRPLSFTQDNEGNWWGGKKAPYHWYEDLFTYINDDTVASGGYCLPK